MRAWCEILWCFWAVVYALDALEFSGWLIDVYCSFSYTHLLYINAHIYIYTWYTIHIIFCIITYGLLYIYYAHNVISVNCSWMNACSSVGSVPQPHLRTAPNSWSSNFGVHGSLQLWHTACVTEVRNHTTSPAHFPALSLACARCAPPDVIRKLIEIRADVNPESSSARSLIHLIPNGAIPCDRAMAQNVFSFSSPHVVWPLRVHLNLHFWGRGICSPHPLSNLAVWSSMNPHCVEEGLRHQIEIECSKSLMQCSRVSEAGERW